MGLLKSAKRDRAAREPRTLEEYLMSGRSAPEGLTQPSLPPWLMGAPAGQFLPPPGPPEAPANYQAPEPPPFPFMDAERHRNRSYWAGAAPRESMQNLAMESALAGPESFLPDGAEMGGHPGFAPPAASGLPTQPEPFSAEDLEWRAAQERARNSILRQQAGRRFQSGLLR